MYLELVTITLTQQVSFVVVAVIKPRTEVVLRIESWWFGQSSTTYSVKVRAFPLEAEGGCVLRDLSGSTLQHPTFDEVGMLCHAHSPLIVVPQEPKDVI